MKRFLSIAWLLASLFLILCCSLSSAAPPQTVPDEIRIVVVSGEAATHAAGERVGSGPTVRIEDDKHSPLADATVVFNLPTWGSTGEFSNGSKTLTITTDQDGLASADGIKTNQAAGKFEIYVTASYRGRRARASIAQFIDAGQAAKTSGGKGKTWIILAIAGAAAAGGIAVAASGGGSSSGSPSTPVPPGVPPIGISPDLPTVGPPGQ